jgi:molecular chaperone DnaK
LVESEAPLSLAPLRTRSPIPAPAPQNQQSQFPAPPRVAPLLLDVTPHTLCVETVGGFCEPIIERNAAIPTEQTRVFTTSRDNQVTVSVRVCQGESRHTDDNEVLGQIDLLGLRQARRGEVHIAVTFVIDVDGTLNVRAIDEATGHGQEIEVNLVGAIGAQEIERMRTRQRAAR